MSTITQTQPNVNIESKVNIIRAYRELLKAVVDYMAGAGQSSSAERMAAYATMSKHFSQPVVPANWRELIESDSEYLANVALDESNYY